MQHLDPRILSDSELGEANSLAWKAGLDQILNRLERGSRKVRRAPYFLIFSLSFHLNICLLQPYVLNVSRVLALTGASLEEESSQSIVDLISQNTWLGVQARRAKKDLAPEDCVNCPPAVVSIANVIQRTENANFSYYSYNFTRPIEDYLALLSGSGSPVFRAGAGNPLNHPLKLWEEPGELKLTISRREDGAIHLISRVQVGDQVLDLQAGQLDQLTDQPLWVISGSDVFHIPASDHQASAAILLEQPEMIIPPEYETEFLERYLLPIVQAIPVEGGDVQWEAVRAAPVKRLYLSEAGQELVARLRFGYGDVEVPYEAALPPATVRHKRDGTWTLLRIHRAPAEEETIYRSISSARSGLKYLRGDGTENGFRLRSAVDIIDFLLKKVPNLLQDGFEIYGEEELVSARVNRSRPTLSLTVSSGIDWFDLTALVEFGDVAASLQEVRRALRKKKRYVKLADGTIGELPLQWVKKHKHLFGLGEQTDQGARLSRHHVTLVEELLREADKARSDRKFKKQLKRLRDFEGIAEVVLPTGFVGKLRPYQKAGYDWLHFLRQYGFGGCLADDMGLGKTIQVLAFLQSLYENGLKGRPSLVVLPRSLLFNWQREASQFTPGLRIIEHFGPARARDAEAFKNYDIVLTTYGTMRRDIQMLRTYDFAYIILDESQAIKNPLAQVSKAARLLNAAHRLVLTGTPVENSTFELWSQFSFLNPGLLGSLEYFKREFANPIERQQDEGAVGVLRKLVYPFILRRTKMQVAPELPPRTERVVYGEMGKDQKKQYERMRDYYRGQVLGLIDGQSVSDARMKILEGLLRLRQISNHPVLVDSEYRGKSAKMDLLLEQLTTLLAEGHKALIFSQFVQMLRLIRAELEARNIPYVYLDGQTTDRQAEVDRFQEDASIPFFLISLRAGGVGLNLTAADYVIHIDPWWNPAVEMQASDRTHRIGQDKPVFVYKLITRDTVEEKILRLQESKKALVDQLIATEGSFFKDLTPDDVKVLFS